MKESDLWILLASLYIRLHNAPAGAHGVVESEKKRQKNHPTGADDEEAPGKGL